MDTRPRAPGFILFAKSLPPASGPTIQDSVFRPANLWLRQGGRLLASLHASLRSQRTIALGQPQRILRSVNQFFYENTTDSTYATLLFAEYNDKTRRLRYANCGHLSALLLRSDNALERLASTCTVLGLFKEWDCAVAERRLFPGDTLALYTDGITESFNDAGEEFGEHRLVESLRRHRERSSPVLVSTWSSWATWSCG